MIKMHVPGDDVASLRSNLESSNEQVLSTLQQLGNTIMQFMDQDEKKEAVRAAQKDTKTTRQTTLALPMMPEQTTVDDKEENEVDAIARECFVSSLGGAHKLDPIAAYDMAAALLVERNRRRDD
jgi:O-acetylhomoserine/O-acetylserine sulfhydrylase-like pyridoxal-dependent enzyme